VTPDGIVGDRVVHVADARGRGRCVEGGRIAVGDTVVLV
jgi:hypothetical protein